MSHVIRAPRRHDLVSTVGRHAVTPARHRSRDPLAIILAEMIREITRLRAAERSERRAKLIVVDSEERAA